MESILIYKENKKNIFLSKTLCLTAQSFPQH